MKHTYKKMLAIFLVMAILLSLVTGGGMSASAETFSGVCGTNATWEFNPETGELTISGTGTVEYGDWYIYRYDIERVTISEGITSIGYWAFEGCSNLTSVTIPSSVTSIGESAFIGCQNLTNITIPNGVTSIGTGAFRLTGLTSITIPTSVTSIGSCAFDNCNLSGITVESGNPVYHSAGNCLISTQDKVLIFGCKNSVIPDDGSVTSIGNSAFWECSNLINIVIPEGVTIIYNGAFNYCVGLKSITIPNSLTEIMNYAFEGCDGLSDVYYVGIQEEWDLISIGSNNYSLENATKHFIPVCNHVFNEWHTVVAPTCTTSGSEHGVCSLCGKEITRTVQATGHNYEATSVVEATCTTNGYTIYTCKKCGNTTNDDYISPFGHNYENSVCTRCGELSKCGANVIWSFNEQTGTLRIYGTGEMDNYSGWNDSTPWASQSHMITTLVVEEGVTSIGDYAFRSCYNLTSVTLPNSLISIGNSAFSGCNLTSVTIPGGVISMGYGVFSSCGYLESITILNGATLIGTDAFRDCWNLTSVTIPGSVMSIGESAFMGCYNLKNITIPNGVKSIGNSAFRYTGLTSITIPSSVNSIDYYAFDGCNLNSITVESGNSVYHSVGNCLISTKNRELILGCNNSVIPNDGSVTSIGSAAFSYCAGLTSITIPEDVTSISSSAFSYCQNFKSITIPYTVTQISGYAFDDCVSLSDVYYTGTQEEWDRISIDNYGNWYLTNATLHFIERCSHIFGEWQVARTPTCGRDGSNVRYCTICGKGETESIPATGLHTYIDTVTAPTCTKQGYTTHTCSVCGNSYVDNYVIGSHEFSNGVCIECGYNYDDIIISGTCGSNLTWEFDTINNALTISGTGAMYNYEMDYWSYYSSAPWASQSENIRIVMIENGVTTIGNNAFSNCYNLTSVSLPNTITSIGDFAFQNCDNLTSITIPNSVTTIGDSAFSECRGLTSVTIPGNVKTIGYGVFQACEGLRSVTIEYGVTSIASYMFSYCSSLTNITIPNSVTSIGYSAFMGCAALTNITIPDSVTTIEPEVFAGCTQLKNVTLSESLTELEATFAGCTALTSILIPDSVTNIGYGAFHGCTGLTDITIPDSVTSLNDGSFYECTALRSITIPNSVTYIAYAVFSGCTSLTDVYYIGSEAEWNEMDIGDNEALTNATIHFIPPCEHVFGDWTVTKAATCTEKGRRVKTCTLCGKTATESIPMLSHSFVNDLCTVCGIAPIASGTCGDNLTWILDDHGVLIISGTGAMDNWSSNTKVPWASKSGTITSVILPNGITSIGKYAFYGCGKLTDIMLPSSITSIGNLAFYRCAGLKSIAIPEGVTAIEASTFGYCSGLTDISIPSSVTSLGDWAFRNCTKLTSVTLPNGITSIGADVFYECSGLTSITLPEGLTSIDVYAFYKCTNLVNVSMPDSIVSIGDAAFGNCNKLAYNTFQNGRYLGNETNPCVVLMATVSTDITDFTVAEGTKIIYSHVFDGTNIASITIPDSVTTFCSAAFSCCTNLTDINIPSKVISIGDYTFNGCISLTSISLPNSVTSIGSYAFSGCIALASISMPGVTSIGSDAFSGCSGLTDITIPNGVTRIAYDTFCNCTGLTNIIIPDGVTSIEPFAFASCTNLTNVSIPDSITEIWMDAFAGCSKLEYNIFQNGKYLGNEKNPYVILMAAISDNCTIAEGTKIIGAMAFNNRTGLTAVTIPESVISIGEYAFESSGLTSITIPANVTSIGYGAFSGCASLTTATVMSGVTTISEYTFAYCTSLTNVTIANGVTSIGWDAFENCTALTSITIPNSVTLIKSSAFYDYETGLPLSDVYYIGTEQQKAGIKIENGNEKLLNATWHYDYSLNCEHNETIIKNAKVATCIECGYTGDTYCAICDTKLAGGEEIPINGQHSYTAFVVLPTCTEQGYTIHTCTVCGDSFVDSVTEPIGHHFGNWFTYIPATCTEEGVEKRICLDCDEEETRLVPAYGHIMSDWIIDRNPTATISGSRHKECIHCHEVLDAEEIPKVGETTAQIVVSSNRAVAGRTFSVTISLKDNPGIASATLKVLYDTSVFTLTGVTDGGLIGTAVHKPELTSPYTLSWANDTAIVNFSDDGTIATLTFTVSEDAEVGSYPINISYSYGNYDIYDVNIEPVRFTVIGGIIDVSRVTIGDVNSDGVINNLDRVILTRYLANWDEYTEDKCDLIAADLDNDGTVNNLDRLILTRYLADWADYRSLPYIG